MSVALASGTLAAGASCTVSVTVTAATQGSYANTSGPASATTAGAGISSNTATLTVNAVHPSISVLKEVSTAATGPWRKFMTVAPGTNVYYRFTVETSLFGAVIGVVLIIVAIGGLLWVFRRYGRR